ncbi:hypothetical protein [Halogeometricum borinquense]|uniref:hypothetical protein n=1 Tax=Halogeometricum borinquense TaxID=60847 RepID=UPI0034147847
MKRRAFLAASTLSIAGISGCLGDTEYRVTEMTTKELTGPLSVSVDLTAANAVIEHPAEFTLMIENTGDDPVRIRSYGVWPFGILSLAQSPNPGEGEWRTTLFSPSYKTSDRVEVKPNGMSLSSEPLIRALESGETVTRQYKLHGADLSSAGTYYTVPDFDGRGSSHTTGDDWTPLDYHAKLTITEKKRLPL